MGTVVQSCKAVFLEVRGAERDRSREVRVGDMEMGSCCDDLFCCFVFCFVCLLFRFCFVLFLRVLIHILDHREHVCEFVRTPTLGQLFC